MGRPGRRRRPPGYDDAAGGWYQPGSAVTRPLTAPRNGAVGDQSSQQEMKRKRRERGRDDDREKTRRKPRDALGLPAGHASSCAPAQPHAATATAAATAAAPQAQRLHERTGDSEGGRRARFFFPWTLVFPSRFAVVGIRKVLGPAGPVRTASVR